MQSGIYRIQCRCLMLRETGNDHVNMHLDNEKIVPKKIMVLKTLPLFDVAGNFSS